MGADSGRRDASVLAITEQLVHSGSERVRPKDVRSGCADPGRIDGSGLRATWCESARDRGEGSNPSSSRNCCIDGTTGGTPTMRLTLRTG